MRDRTAHSRRVVVVEDDPSIGVLIASVLADEGYSPIVVQDGRQALRVVQDLHPDAVTLDLELPGLDGHTVLRRLAADISDAPPVVVVSASMESLSNDEREMVACALTKPFDLYDLVRAIECVVTRDQT